MSEEENHLHQLNLFKQTAQFLRFQLDSSIPNIYTSLDKSKVEDIINECENILLSVTHLKQVVGTNVCPSRKNEIGRNVEKKLKVPHNLPQEKKTEEKGAIENNFAVNVENGSYLEAMELYPRLISDMASYVEAHGNLKKGYYCGICNVISMSPEVWETHLSSKDHVARVSACRTNNVELENWACKTCALQVCSEAAHICIIFESQIHKNYDLKVKEITEKKVEVKHQPSEINANYHDDIIVKECKILNEAIANGKISGGYYCRLCNTGVETQDWQSHKLMRHNNSSNRYEGNVEKCCSLCQSGVFIDKKFIDDYMAYHHLICHPEVTCSKDLSRINFSTNTGLTVRPAMPRPSLDKKASVLDPMILAENDFVIEIEAEFQVFQELRRQGNKLASAGFCWTCLKIFKNSFDWIGHVNSHKPSEGVVSTCETCDLAFFGPKKNMAYFFKNKFHVDLDDTIIFLRC